MRKKIYFTSENLILEIFSYGNFLLKPWTISAIDLMKKNRYIQKHNKLTINHLL